MATQANNSGCATAAQGGFALFILVAFVGLILQPQCGSARETGRQNTCRENLRKLAVATIDYDTRHGALPGYINAMVTPVSGAPTKLEFTPVSWAEELLETLDRAELAEMSRNGSPAATPSATPSATSSANGTATSTSSATSAAGGTLPERDTYVRDFFVCPSHEIRPTRRTLSYVANTGFPDLPQAIAPQDGRAGIPRDWPANGVFFDRYGKLNKSLEGKWAIGTHVSMSLVKIRDPRDKTILFTENLDAGPWVVAPNEFPGGDPARAEILWGAVWGAGPIEDGKEWKSHEIANRSGSSGNSAPTPHVRRDAPTMQPPPELLRPNIEGGRRTAATSYRFSRPSSRHPQGFNAAFAGGNVVFIRDSISYFVYAKLMASDDANAQIPGSQELVDERFRKYELQDADINP